MDRKFFTIELCRMVSTMHIATILSQRTLESKNQQLTQMPKQE